jgi:hypothetical protein
MVSLPLRKELLYEKKEATFFIPQMRSLPAPLRSLLPE